MFRWQGYALLLAAVAGIGWSDDGVLVTGTASFADGPPASGQVQLVLAGPGDHELQLNAALDGRGRFALRLPAPPALVTRAGVALGPGLAPLAAAMQWAFAREERPHLHLTLPRGWFVSGRLGGPEASRALLAASYVDTDAEAEAAAEGQARPRGRNEAPQPTDKIVLLKSKVQQYHSTWDVDTPGPTSGCSLNATNNVQGRHLNGVTAVCSASASSYTGRFIHIEQDPSYRSASDWLQPVIDAWSSGSPSQPVTLTPTADAYVRGGSHAASNFGAATALHAKIDVDTAGNQRRAFLKFDLTAVASVASAKLRLYASLSATNSPLPGLSVFAVSNTSWGETSVTYNNMPALGSQLGSVAVSSTSYAWKEIDVTSYVQAEKAAGRNVVTLGLNGSIDSYGYVQAYSREAAAANRPQLVVQP